MCPSRAMAKSFETWVFNLHLVGSYRLGNGKLNGYYRNYRDSIGIIGLYWCCIGAMENEVSNYRNYKDYIWGL